MTIRVTADNPAFLIDDSFTPPRVVGIKQRDGSEAYFDTNPTAPSLAGQRLVDAYPWRVLAASAAAVSHTGNTNETTLATVPIPAGVMGSKGILRVTTLWSHTNSVNNKTLRIRPGSGNRLLVANVTTSASTRDQRMFSNRDSTASQISGGNGGLATGNWGATADAVVTNTIDTTAAFDFTITGQLASGSETVTLESYLFELLSRD